MKIIKELCIYIAIFTGIITIFNFVLMLNFVPSQSMENTIMTDDMVIATRFDRKDISRYDIVIFDAPDDPGTYYIKRVIGLPGETITVDNGNVYANGVCLEDSFVKSMDITDGDGVYEVPEGHYFMMGDNRDESLDARYWKNKYVAADMIMAKAKIVVYPLTHIQILNNEKGHQ